MKALELPSDLILVPKKAERRGERVLDTKQRVILIPERLCPKMFLRAKGKNEATKLVVRKEDKKLTGEKKYEKIRLL